MSAFPYFQIAIVICIAAVTLSSAEESTTDFFQDNNVETKPSVRLDPYIRKALLKALSELEESETFSTDPQITDSSTTDNESTNPTEAPVENVRFHSFIVNGQSAFANASYSRPTNGENRISILSTRAGNVEDQLPSTIPTKSPFSEIFQARETGVNVLQVRSIPNKSKNDNDNSIQNNEANTKPRPTTASTTTTTTITTTTTPKPTHNDDGENIEDVSKKDVQVFQAPLVAAFTVHQDERGLPKSVVPIFQQNLQAPTKASLEPLVQQLPISQGPDISKAHPVFISQQIALQRQLEEKQRILEEQLRQLQIQQRQQEELLRKQHFLLQQKETQRQQQQQQLYFEQEQFKRQQLLAEQQRLQENQQFNNFQLPNSQKANNFLVPPTRPQNAQVTIQSSVPLDQNNFLVSQQQLPNREAVDFLIHLHNQHRDQFPLQENHLPPGISNFLQPGPVAPSFHQGPNFNQIKSVEDQFRQGNRQQGNRVFRHETGVGNFGFNNNQQAYNRFNTFNPVQSNRFFTNRQNQFNDSELKQLLVRNGLNGRSHEDLNIVSKVLSLNHGIPINNNVSNRLTFDSRRHIRN